MQASPEFEQSVREYQSAKGSARHRELFLDQAREVVLKRSATGVDLQYLCDQIAQLQQRVNVQSRPGVYWQPPGPHVLRKQLKDLQHLKAQIIESDTQIAIEQVGAEAIAKKFGIPEHLLLAYVPARITNQTTRESVAYCF